MHSNENGQNNSAQASLVNSSFEPLAVVPGAVVPSLGPNRATGSVQWLAWFSRC